MIDLSLQHSSFHAIIMEGPYFPHHHYHNCLFYSPCHNHAIELPLLKITMAGLLFIIMIVHHHGRSSSHLHFKITLDLL
jgi:hypothetical protein